MTLLRGLRALVGELWFAGWTFVVGRVAVRPSKAARYADQESIGNAWRGQ